MNETRRVGEERKRKERKKKKANVKNNFSLGRLKIVKKFLLFSPFRPVTTISHLFYFEMINYDVFNVTEL